MPAPSPRPTPPVSRRRLVDPNPRITQPRDLADLKATELTFGVEDECFVPNAAWSAAGWQRTGYHGVGGQIATNRGWRSTTDGSLRPPAGHVATEIVSGILRGQAGLLSVTEMLKRLREMRATVNHSCGFHVHVGWPAEASMDALRRLLQLFANHERGLYAITGTIRRELGVYSAPIKDALRPLRNARTVDEIAAHQAAVNRRAGLNIQNLLGFGRQMRTVEFRLWSPTLSEPKALLFTQLSLGLVHKALDTKADAAWDSKAKLPERRAGTAEAIRLFNALGWVKSKQRKAYGLITVERRMELMKEALRLSVRYDQRREAWQTHHQANPSLGELADPAWEGEL